MWRKEYLDYDYIGAPWWFYDGLNVGNGGFCIKSRALLEFLTNNKDKFPPSMQDDNTICREYQPLLPQFKWAPDDLAHDFAFERTRQSIESRHFGFHGMFNWPFVLPPDRLAERMALARLDPYIKTTTNIRELDGLFAQRWIGKNFNWRVSKGAEL